MAEQVENITPYLDDRRQKTEQVKEMFDSIAQAYDFMNRAMTFGVDKLWRRKAVRMLEKKRPRSILDLATGTGDLAIALAKKIPDAKVTGADLSPQMLEVGRRKVRQAGLAQRIEMLEADGTALPFADNSFESVTIAYGIRNFESMLAGYREMFRVLRPGGTLLVVELATPVSAVPLAFYKVYTRWIIPAVGRLVSKEKRAYSYLPESIAAVPQRHSMLSLMEQAGFCDTIFKSLTFGTCIIYSATKPGAITRNS